MVAKLWKFIILISLLVLGVVDAEKQESWRYYIPPERLLSPRITCLYLDTTDSAVYIGTARGLNRIEGDRLTSHGRSVNLPYGEIEDFAKGNRGRLWCIVEGQVYVFTRDVSDRSRWYKCVLEDLDTGEVATVLEAGPEDITIGTNRGSIYARGISETLEPEMVGKQDTTKVSVEESTNLPDAAWIFDMAYWERGIYCLATSNGLVKFYSVSNAIEKVRREGILSSSINCVEVGSDSTLWFADSNFVGRFNLSDKSSATELLFIPGINNMSFDPIGHLWCANDSAIFEVYPKEFDLVEHPLPKTPGFLITSLLALNENEILVGTDKGLFVFNPPRPVVTVKIKGVEESEDGVLAKFKVQDFSSYPHLILKWSINESDYSKWLILEAKTNHTLNIGTLEDGEHELRIIVKPPLEGIDSTEVFYVFETGKLPFNWGLIIAIVIFAIVIGIGIVTLVLLTKRQNEIEKLRMGKARLAGNPYIVGPPIIDPKDFIGRERILDEILAGIHINSFLIHGLRRIGKTSVLYQIRNRIRATENDEYRIFPIMVNLQKFSGRRTSKGFYTNLAHEMAEAIYSKTKRDKVLEKEYDYNRFELFMESLAKNVQRRSRSKTARVILLIDEGDKMTAYGSNFHEQFRGLFQSSYAERFNVVLTLREFSLEWTHNTSPWYNFFITKPLGPMTQDDTEALIQSYVEGAVKYKTRALDLIWERTQGHPYEVQKLCSAIYDSLKDEIYVLRKHVKKVITPHIKRRRGK